MFISNFWYYIFFAVIILHVVIGFIYLAIKLSPKKDKNKDKNKDIKDNNTKLS